MQELFKALPGYDLVADRIHSRADLTKYLGIARRDRRIRVIHIVSHGEYSPKRPGLVLTGDEKINLAEEGKSLFKGLHGKVIIFSCCEIGYHADLMRSLLKASQARAIFSYTDRVSDSQALVTEALFYHLAHPHLGERNSTEALREVHERLKFALSFLGIDRAHHSLSDPLFVADFE